MPFHKGDPRAAAAGRKGQNIRWSKATPADKAEATRVMREAQAAKYVEQAGDTLTRMGITPTPEQVEQAATALQRADLRDRLAKGREAKAELRSHEDAWMTRVHRLAGMFIDGLVGELGLTPDMSATVAKVTYLALGDEAAKRQADRDYQFLRRRWEDYRLYVHEQHCPEHRYPDAPCLTCGLAGVA